jgi:hypothetical protein
MIAGCVSIVLTTLIVPEDSITAMTVIIGFVTFGITQVLTLRKVNSIEHHTNAMKDQLIEQAGKAGFRAGQDHAEAVEEQGRSRKKETQ